MEWKQVPYRGNPTSAHRVSCQCLQSGYAGTRRTENGWMNGRLTISPLRSTPRLHVLSCFKGTLRNVVPMSRQTIDTLTAIEPDSTHKLMMFMVLWRLCAFLPTRKLPIPRQVPSHVFWSRAIQAELTSELLSSLSRSKPSRCCKLSDFASQLDLEGMVD